MSNQDEKGRFKPGNNANPTGRPKLPLEIREIKKLSPAYVRQVIAKLSRMGPDELLSWLETPFAAGGPNNLEHMVASIIRKSAIDGDQNRLNFLLDRSIGKVVEQKVVTLQPVEYITSVRPDGALVQAVINEALGEDEGDGNGDSDQGHGA